MEEIPVTVQIDPALVEPVPVPDREIRPLAEGGLTDTSLLLTDYDEALGTANGQILAIRDTLDLINTRVQELRCQKFPDEQGCDEL